MNTRSNLKLLAFVVLIAVIGLACGGGTESTPFPEVLEASPTPIPEEPTAEVTKAPTAAPDTSELPEWTVIVYSDADDEVLEESLWQDVNEMELVGSNDQMNIVVQMDRYGGAFDGDGDWSDTRRLFITQDDDLSAINSPVIEELGETDAGDPQTLVDFVTTAIQNAPAKKYALIMSDHGGGWTGGFLDGDSPSYSSMTLPEITSAIDQIIQTTGIEKFELIGFDACLMAQMEVFGSLYLYSNYMVASEETIPGYGFSYAAWLGQLAQDPTMDGAGLSQSIVSTYVVDDTSWIERRASADEIAQDESTTTLSAVESARVPDLISAMNQFIDVMASIDQTQVAEARTYTRSYTSVFDDNLAPPFIDLGNFAETLSRLTGDADVQQAADQLQTAISSAVIDQKNGQALSGSNGISFHFPDSDLYHLTEFNEDYPLYYAADAAPFLEQSSWDEFLAFHYTGEDYVPQEGQAYAPSRSAEVVAPGASELTVGPIEISDTEITGDEEVTVSTTVEGNVSYLYTVLYFYNPDTEDYWVGDISYYIADNTMNIDGVNLPDYGDSPIHVEYDWSPTLYTLTDGQHEAYVLAEPQEYLTEEGNTVYGVHGQYTDVMSNTPVEAWLSFDADGNFLYAYAFPDEDGDGASNPVEISPQIGDHFTDYVQFIAYDQNDEPYFDSELSDDVWTWGEKGFSFYGDYPVDGDYAVGIIAYDFDNNWIANYEFITYKQQ